MTELKTETKYFAGNARANEWSGVYFYAPQVPATFEQKGEIFAVLSLRGSASFDAQTSGNLLVDHLHELYFESNEKSNLYALEKALIGIQKRLLELIEHDEENSQSGIEMEIATIVIRDGIAYAACMGESKIFGIREDLLAEISSVLKDPDGRSNLRSGSWKISSQDKFLLLTSEADFEIKMPEKLKILNEFSLKLIKGKYLANEALVSCVLVGLDINLAADDMDPNDPVIEMKAEEKIEEQIDEDEYYEKKILNANNDEKFVAATSRAREHSQNDFEEKASTLSNIDIKGKLNTAKNWMVNVSRSKNAKTFQVVIASTGYKISEFLKWFYVWFKEDVLKMSDKRTYGRNAQSRNWRPIIFFSVVIIFAFYFITTRIKENRRIAQIEFDANTTLTSVETDLGELEERAGGVLNSHDRESEREDIFGELTGLKTKIEVISVESLTERKKQSLDKIVILENKLSRKLTIENPNVVKDLGIIEGSVPNDIEISDDRIFVSDSGVGTIHSMKFDGSDMNRLGEKLTNVSSISLSQNGELLFIDPSDKEHALGMITINNAAVKRFPGMTSDRLGELSQIDSYKVNEGDERLYAARINSKELIQVKKGTAGYSIPEIRLTNNNFGRLLDVEVSDGRIYLVSENQGVREFFLNTEVNVVVAGMMNGDNWANANSIFVDAKYVYLTDNPGKRILIFTKDRGNNSNILDFVASVDLSNIPESSNMKDLAVDKSRSSIYLLAGTKVFKIDLAGLKQFSY